MPDRIYLDSCVLNRPTDDQTQERIHLESLAIAQILDAVAAGQLEWIGSSLLQYEILQNRNPGKRNDALTLLTLASLVVEPTEATRSRARLHQNFGLAGLDALHLALAEQAHVSVLLTVDDRFINRSATRPAEQAPLVENPVNWLRRRHPWLIKR